MRSLVVVLIVVLSTPAVADPSWTDVPALVAAATAPVDAELGTCMKDRTGPRTIAMFAARTKTGTVVAMPMPPVGGRGFTPEERCLMATIAKIQLPPLPDGIERILLGHTVGDTAVEPAFDDWRDPAAAIAKVVDPKALAACDAKPRTVRLIFDLRADATRIWLPAWQFHAANGDGTTPPAQARVKACLTKVTRGWRAPKLPRAMPELHLALSVAP